jgi:hypothetical protein
MDALHGKQYSAERYWWAMSEENVEIFKRGLEPWAMQSVAFARALPPKEKK